MFISSAVISALFFGGYNFPGMDAFSGNTLAILGTLVFFGKTFFFIFVFMWIRWTLPRFRYDQLMHLGWKKLIPISMINLLVTGVVIAFTSGWFTKSPKSVETVPAAKKEVVREPKQLSMYNAKHEQ
jgi:NADH-quinone oxidoreductase subunit H